MTSESPTPTPPDDESDVDATHASGAPPHDPTDPTDQPTANQDSEATRVMDPVAPPAPETQPGLYRSRTDRMLAGVCGGIAERYGIEALLVRLAFIATLFIGGAGVLFYVAAAIVMPNRPTAPDGTPLTANGGGAANSAGNGILRILVALAVGLAVLAGLLMLAGFSLGSTLFFGAWPVALIVVVLAAVLALNAGSRRATGTLVVLILVLVLPAAAVVVADVSIDRSAGERTEQPVSVADAEQGYRLGLGELVVDLRDLPLTARATPITIPVRVDVGRAAIVIPDDRCVDWTIRTSVGLGGDVRVLDQGRSNVWIGNQQDRTFRVDPEGTDARPQVTIDAHVGAGQIAVVNSIRELDRLDDRARGHRSVVRTDACRPKARSGS